MVLSEKLSVFSVKVRCSSVKGRWRRAAPLPHDLYYVCVAALGVLRRAGDFFTPPRRHFPYSGKDFGIFEYFGKIPFFWRGFY